MTDETKRLTSSVSLEAAENGHERSRDVAIELARRVVDAWHTLPGAMDAVVADLSKALVDIDKAEADFLLWRIRSARERSPCGDGYRYVEWGEQIEPGDEYPTRPGIGPRIEWLRAGWTGKLAEDAPCLVYRRLK